MECTKKMTHLALSQDAKMAILTCPFEPPKLGPLAPTQGQQLCNAWWTMAIGPALDSISAFLVSTILHTRHFSWCKDSKTVERPLRKSKDSWYAILYYIYAFVYTYIQVTIFDIYIHRCLQRLAILCSLQFPVNPLNPPRRFFVSLGYGWLDQLWWEAARPKTKHKLDIRSGEDYKKLYEHEQKCADVGLGRLKEPLCNDKWSTSSVSPCKHL